MKTDATIALQAPLAGWCAPLEEVPDPVFAGRMAGDGVAIDPTSNVLHAPCDGEVVLMPGAKHALNLRTASGAEILLHIGIDTVHMNGEGFELLVAGGERVRAGNPLIRFDLDRVARKARSVMTPILIASGGVVRKRAAPGPLPVGAFLFEIGFEVARSQSAAAAEGEEIRRAFSVPFDHGLHARPAALVAAALKPFAAEVTVVARGRSGNARSTVALMSLGVAAGETIEVRATGADAAEALAALAPLLADPARPATAAPRAPQAPPHRLPAVIASRGLAIGSAIHFTRPDIPVVEGASDAPAEAARLRSALETVAAHLDTLAHSGKADQREIFAAHRELIQDPELVRGAESTIAQGKSAGFAWRAATRGTVEALGALHDARMRERAADLRDLESQVLRVLNGEKPSDSRELPANAIVLADELLPSQLVGLDRTRIAGFCTVRGGPTSHVAILAAAMGLPALVAAGERLLDVPEGTPLVLDAEKGRLEVDPPERERQALEQEIAARKAQQAADLAAAHEPAHTRDGVAIAVYANVGSVADAKAAITQGAEGCGLLRTEFLFLERREAPSEDEQAQEYQRIAEALGARPLTIRTLDIGGDKPIAYLPLPHEENPALGLRGLRTSLRHPELLREQLRAILRVTPAGRCRILLPMVTDVEDIRVVRGVLAECMKALDIREAPALGVMIETPASALLADQLAVEADFISIGTNDLSQYTLAMDRGHPELASRLDGLHPAVLRLIDKAAGAGEAQHKEVAVCGGLGSDPAALPLLIGLGVREISAVPSALPRIKRMVRSLDAGACRNLAQRALDQPDAAAVRALVEAAFP